MRTTVLSLILSLSLSARSWEKPRPAPFVTFMRSFWGLQAKTNGVPRFCQPIQNFSASANPYDGTDQSTAFLAAVNAFSGPSGKGGCILLTANGVGLKVLSQITVPPVATATGPNYFFAPLMIACDTPPLWAGVTLTSADDNGGCLLDTEYNGTASGVQDFNGGPALLIWGQGQFAMKNVTLVDASGGNGTFVQTTIQSVFEDVQCLAAINTKDCIAVGGNGATYANTASPTATASSGAGTITVNSNTGLLVGMTCQTSVKCGSGGMSVGTIITAINGTTISISPNTTGVMAGTSVTFDSATRVPIASGTGYYSDNWLHGEVWMNRISGAGRRMVFGQYSYNDGAIENSFWNGKNTTTTNKCAIELIGLGSNNNVKSRALHMKNVGFEAGTASTGFTCGIYLKNFSEMRIDSVRAWDGDATVTTIIFDTTALSNILTNIQIDTGSSSVPFGGTISATNHFQSYSGTTGNVGGSSVAAGACATAGTATLTGVVVGMPVTASPTTVTAGFYPVAWVSSANTVTATLCNGSTTATPSTTTMNVTMQ